MLGFEIGVRYEFGSDSERKLIEVVPDLIVEIDDVVELSPARLLLLLLLLPFPFPLPFCANVISFLRDRSKKYNVKNFLIDSLCLLQKCYKLLELK